MKKVIVRLPSDKAASEKIINAASGYFISDFIGPNDNLNEPSLQEFSVASADDIERIRKAVESGAKAVKIETRDWRVIPLENIISLVSGKAVLYAEAKSVEDAVMLEGVLEKGVDGIIISPKSVEELASYVDALGIGRSSVKYSMMEL